METHSTASPSPNATPVSCRSRIQQSHCRGACHPPSRPPSPSPAARQARPSPERTTIIWRPRTKVVFRIFLTREGRGCTSLVGCLDASIEVSSIGLKSYTHLEKAGDIMHRANAHVRAGLVSVVLTVSAICILASPTLGQVRRRDKAWPGTPAASSSAATRPGRPRLRRSKIASMLSRPRHGRRFTPASISRPPSWRGRFSRRRKQMSASRRHTARRDAIGLPGGSPEVLRDGPRPNGSGQSSKKPPR